MSQEEIDRSVDRLQSTSNKKSQYKNSNLTSEEKDFLMNCTFTPSINNNTAWNKITVTSVPKDDQTFCRYNHHALGKNSYVLSTGQTGYASDDEADRKYNNR